MRPIAILFVFICLALICRPCYQFADYTVWLFIDTFTLAWRILLLIYVSIFILAIWMLIMHTVGLWNG